MNSCTREGEGEVGGKGKEGGEVGGKGKEGGEVGGGGEEAGEEQLLTSYCMASS